MFFDRYDIDMWELDEKLTQVQMLADRGIVLLVTDDEEEQEEESWY